jgi:hypothetical protein
MTLGQLYNDSGLLGLSMGSTQRDGLTLYPLWKFLFHCEPIGGVQSIQVGVWGDTKEIAYCGTYGFFGMPATSSSPQPTMEPSNSPSPSPTLQPTLEPIKTPDFVQIGDFTPAIILISTIAFVIAVGAIVCFKKHKRS